MAHKKAPRKKPAPAAPSKALGQKAREICRRLVKEYPGAKCRLDFTTPYELLVATILAAQCTDDMVNKVTPVLFAKARTPQALAVLAREEIEAIVRPTGFYHNKAKSIHEMSRVLVDQHGGEVPREMEKLVRLPGVARKTANVLRGRARPAGDHHGHALHPPLAADGPDEERQAREDRVRPPGAPPRGPVVAVQPRDALPWPRGLRSPEARVRPVRGQRPVPVGVPVSAFQEGVARQRGRFAIISPP